MTGPDVYPPRRPRRTWDQALFDCALAAVVAIVVIVVVVYHTDLIQLARATLTSAP